MSEDSPLPPDIIVIGSRITGASNYVTLPSWTPYFYSIAGHDLPLFNGAQAIALVDDTSPNHLKRIVIDGIVQQFAENYDIIANIILSVDPNAAISIGNNQLMSGADLIASLRALQFHVTDKSYLPGYGGGNDGKIVEINWQILGRYNGRGQEGTNYLVLHEIAHNTVTGILTRSWMVNSQRDALAAGFNPGGYYGTNVFFHQQEAYANSIALAMANSLGVSILVAGEPGWPPHGFVQGF